MPNITENYGEEKRVMKGRLANYKNSWHSITDGYGDDGMHTIEEFDEIDDQIIRDKWKQVQNLRKSGLNTYEICSKLSITEEELNDVAVDYSELTGL